MNKLFLFLITNMIFFGSFASRETLILTNKTINADLTPYIEYYKDTALNTTIEYIADSVNNKIFKPITGKIINLENSGHVYWLHFDVINQSKQDNWIINIDFPTLTNVAVFILNAEGKVDTILIGGTDFPENNKFMDYTSVSHPFDCNTGQSLRVYIRVQTNAFYILPIRIMTTESYITKTVNKHSLLGVLFGFVLAALIINVILYTKSKEKYLIITLFLMIATTLFMLYQYGFGNEPLSFINPGDKDKIRLVLFAVVELFFNLFTIQFLNLKEHKYVLKTLQGTSIFLSLYIAIIVMPFTPLFLIPKFNSIITFLLGLIWLGAGIFSIFRKQSQSKIYVFAVSFLFFSNIIWIFLTQEKIPFNFITSHVTIIGITSFIILLTYGAIGRIYELRREQQRIEQLESSNILLKEQIEIRKKTEQTLRESEEKFRSLFDLSPQPIIVTEFETGRIDDVNNKALELTNFKPKDIVNRTTIDLNFIDATAREKLLSEIQRNGEVKGMETYFITPEGSTMYFLLFSKATQINGRKKLITILSDITSIKKGELEIRKLTTAIEKSANIFIITNANGEIEYVNEYFTELTGFSKTEVLGKKSNIWKTNFHSDSFYKDLWNTIKQGKIWQGEFHNQKKNGEYYWESATIVPIFDDSGVKIVNFVAAKVDITEKKQHIEKLVQSEKILLELNATKDKFFSIIGHDLMNPFNALLGYSNLLIETLRNENNTEGLGFAQNISHASRRVLDLLQNLLLWSKAQSGQIYLNPKMVEVKTLVSDSLSVILPATAIKKIDIKIDIESNLKAVIDYNMIGSVIRNLVWNAIKFTNPGGTVIISANVHDNTLKFKVSDNGIGINEEQFGQLFELGKTYVKKGTANETGTGLGLVICKEFIDIHKGKIWVESTPGKGSDFYFTIPVGLDTEIEQSVDRG
jgi:PAS domain S-box-containing protein